MANRVDNFLKSYDFFGKSIPGIVLIIGVLTLFPSLPLVTVTNSTQGLNFPSLTALAISLVFAGLVMGQAVHTLAVNVEKILYWAGHTSHNLYHEYLADRIERLFEEERCLGRLVRGFRLDSVWRFIRPWVVRQYWGVHDVFKSHRRLFENSLGWHFDGKVSRRRGDEVNIIYHGFSQAFDRTFSTDPYDDLSDFGIQTERYEEFRQIYPLVATEITEQEQSRASGFQARYSFCRGMWVVLGIMLIVYLLVFYVDLPGFTHDPLIVKEVTPPLRGYFFGALVLSLLVFMDASGDYKRYYVEYLITEFYAKFGKKNDVPEE